MTTPMYFEDFAVGMRFGGTAETTVTEADIVAFAKAYDPQPFHLDAEAAARGAFGRLVTSGWHTAALSMRLITADGPPIAGGLVGMGPHELTWPRPVVPGDRLRIAIEIVECLPSKSRADRGWLRARCTTTNQHGEAVQILVARMMAPRRPRE